MTDSLHEQPGWLSIEDVNARRCLNALERNPQISGPLVDIISGILISIFSSVHPARAVNAAFCFLRDTLAAVLAFDGALDDAVTRRDLIRPCNHEEG